MIRTALDSDFPSIASIFREVVAEGESYDFPADATQSRTRFGARARGQFALNQAELLGFTAMQFNFVLYQCRCSAPMDKSRL